MDIIDRVITREGGAKITRDPVDPGGVTKYGISQRSHPDVDVENLTYDQARDIYLAVYIKQPRLHLIDHPQLAEVLIDFGVHSGPETAIKCLQRVLGVQQDGQLGPKTLQALERFSPEDLVKAITIQRCLFLARQVQNKPTKLKYLSGWLSRVLSLL